MLAENGFSDFGGRLGVDFLHIIVKSQYVPQPQTGLRIFLLMFFNQFVKRRHAVADDGFQSF